VGLDWLTFVLAAGTFLAVEVLLIASVLRLWRAAGAGPPRQGRLPVRWGWELVWTLLPVLGLAALALLGAQALLSRPSEPPAGRAPAPMAEESTKATGTTIMARQEIRIG
jgi:heme/copper-type cytochrome/quinol oxidase subunit 2